MNICYDLNYLQKEKQGGISRMWLEYFKLLRGSEIDAKFLIGTNNDNITNKYLENEHYLGYKKINSNVYFNSNYVKFIQKLSLYRNILLLKLIPKDTKIFHSTDYINPIFRLKNVKIVTTIHDMVFWDQKDSFTKGIAYWDKVWSIYHSLRVSDKVITVSDTSKKSIIKYFPWVEDKIFVNYHGLPETFQNLKLNLNKEKYFMFVGGRNKYKNYNYLINSFAKFARLNSDWKLIVVGENHKTKITERKLYNTLGIDQLVTDLGMVPEEKLIGLLQNATALIIPSLNEGFNFPLLEGLAAGCPVLSSDIPVSKEIGHTNVKYFSIDPNNTNNLINCMTKHVNDKIRYNDLIKGQKHARSFSWNKSFNKLLKIYESCI